MAKGKTLVVVVIIFGIIGLFLFFPMISQLFGNSQGLGVTFYDENGKAYSDTYAYQSGNELVSSFSVTVWWVVTGTDVDLSTLLVQGSLNIQLLSTYDKWVTLQTETWSAGNEGEADSQHTTPTYSLSDLLSAYQSEEYRTIGWVIKIPCVLTVDLDDSEGNALATQTYNLVTQFTLFWYEGAFTVDSGITYVQG